MKTILLAALLLFCPLVFFAQTLTGLWIGTVNNDSNTIRKDQSFEIVLTQYKNKVYGFSRSTFVVNDSLFYIVKRVKGTIEGDVCEVKDDDIVSYNFKGRLDKGVKMVSTFRFDHEDSVWRMDGDWKTNRTKKYYSVSGKIALAQEKDLEKSKIFPHLQELKLADDVAFFKESKKVSEPVASTTKPVKDKPQGSAVTETKPNDVARVKQTEAKEKPVIPTKTEPVAIKQPDLNNQKESIAKEQKTEPVKEVKQDVIVQTNQPANNPKKDQPTEEKKAAVVVNNKKEPEVIVQAKTNPVIQTNQPAIETKKPIVVKEEKQEAKKSEPIAVTKPVEQKKEPVIQTPNPELKNKETASVPVINNKSQPVSIFAETKPAVTPTAAVFVAERKVAAPQIVEYKSDSLELVLYDNGEVDGDTVSVLLNGEIILAKQGLKASAIKKMIYIPAGKDDPMTLVLYAENLGKYPPNTGLLIVHDGEESYQIRFSADFAQNAAVIFKRKKN